ncbi:MAG: hypothetical protein J5585_01445 [Clostridia bacterium]|nr:hypothetical protein [Clostridia bacterium]
MAKERLDIKNELQQFRFDMNFLQKIDCTKEENNTYQRMLKNGESLPNGVYQYKDPTTEEYIQSFYTVWDPELTDAEKQEYIKYKELLHIKTIKNCVVFFTVLTIISLVATVVILLLR